MAKTEAPKATPKNIPANQVKGSIRSEVPTMRTPPPPPPKKKS